MLDADVPQNFRVPDDNYGFAHVQTAVVTTVGTFAVDEFDEIGKGVSAQKHGNQVADNGHIVDMRKTPTLPVGEAPNSQEDEIRGESR